MSIVGELSALGLSHNAELAGAATGNLLPQASPTPVAFTGGLITRTRKKTRGNATELERELVLQAATLAATPRARDRLTFTGDPTEWSVIKADPITSGTTVTGWRLTLNDQKHTEED